MPQDRYYADERTHLVDFAFDKDVVAVFPDMIRRSVPGYELIVPMTGLMAAQHVTDGGHIYDLGCSLGATTLAVLQQVGDRDCRITGVDNSLAMIEQARAKLTDPRISLRHEDVRELAFEESDVIMSNWLLQFLPPEDRPAFIARLREALRPGGVLLLSEKVCFDDETRQRFNAETHHQFKRANGYSELEVAQKRTALENVMVPDTEALHLSRLQAAGFAEVEVWFRCLNWISLIART